MGNVISEYMHQELVNWGRSCLFANSGGHCASIEHRYQPESDIGKVVKPRLEIRTLDAEKIEKTISVPSFPRKHRKLLINHYVWRHPYEKICKTLGISFKHFDYEHERAVNILENRMKILHKHHI